MCSSTGPKAELRQKPEELFHRLKTRTSANYLKHRQSKQKGLCNKSTMTGGYPLSTTHRCCKQSCANAQGVLSKTVADVDTQLVSTLLACEPYGCVHASAQELSLLWLTSLTNLVWWQFSLAWRGVLQARRSPITYLGITFPERIDKYDEGKTNISADF